MGQVYQYAAKYLLASIAPDQRHLPTVDEGCLHFIKRQCQQVPSRLAKLAERLVRRHCYTALQLMVWYRQVFEEELEPWDSVHAAAKLHRTLLPGILPSITNDMLAGFGHVFVQYGAAL